MFGEEDDEEDGGEDGGEEEEEEFRPARAVLVDAAFDLTSERSTAELRSRVALGGGNYFEFCWEGGGDREGGDECNFSVGFRDTGAGGRSVMLECSEGCRISCAGFDIRLDVEVRGGDWIGCGVDFSAHTETFFFTLRGQRIDLGGDEGAEGMRAAGGEFRPVLSFDEGSGGSGGSGGGVRLNSGAQAFQYLGPEVLLGGQGGQGPQSVVFPSFSECTQGVTLSEADMCAVTATGMGDGILGVYVDLEVDCGDVEGLRRRVQEGSIGTYWEFEVQQLGVQGLVQVGLVGRDAGFDPAGSSPIGWQAGTIGYHSDDGIVFFDGSQHTASVVGCGFALAEGGVSVYFTKDGQLLDRWV
ncbi:hypothetical protein B484DRAFT_400338 [Ochromonadaceae sp. CCMP2298]|nr:hypothetical protein B484DRAFT_400338 [Ochromonadaceae sp. CCMP2298]